MSSGPLPVRGTGGWHLAARTSATARLLTHPSMSYYLSGQYFFVSSSDTWCNQILITLTEIVFFFLKNWTRYVNCFVIHLYFFLLSVGPFLIGRDLFRCRHKMWWICEGCLLLVRLVRLINSERPQRASRAVSIQSWIYLFVLPLFYFNLFHMLSCRYSTLFILVLDDLRKYHMHWNKNLSSGIN